MSSAYKVLTPGDLSDIVHPNQAFAVDVLIGLSGSPKRLQSKYFYDDKGSRLFQEIMGLSEYYLTDCEFEILETYKSDITAMLAAGEHNIVELGAGDGLKTSVLIEELQKTDVNFRFVPIDISEGAMDTLIDSVSEKFPSIRTEGIVAEYFDGLKWLSNFADQKNIVLFLGSNLGNFPRAQAKIFLRSLWNALNNGDYVLIGFDLKKDIDLMLRAYNDSQGVTAEFNLNLLDRINRELGGDFNREKFRFYASYNVFSGAIESYLVSLEEQSVFIEEIGQSFSFDAWEPIHTEYSYKFLESDIESLAAKTGYVIHKRFYDSRKFFTDSLWRVEKEEG